ncbi:hypothetical protein [Ferrovibrio terrae]|uniref:hypothetical protein n=1 Tax=Ferrovibrio terrae TaxID=2594003 RepID=UPI003137EBA1
MVILNDPVRQLVRAQLAALDLNMAEVSRSIGRSHSYLQQFLERGVPRALPEDVRDELAKKLNLEPAQLRGDKNRRPQGGITMKSPAFMGFHEAPPAFEHLVLTKQQRDYLDMMAIGMSVANSEVLAFVDADIEALEMGEALKESLGRPINALERVGLMQKILQRRVLAAAEKPQVTQGNPQPVTARKAK